MVPNHYRSRVVTQTLAPVFNSKKRLSSLRKDPKFLECDAEKNKRSTEKPLCRAENLDTELERNWQALLLLACAVQLLSCLVTARYYPHVALTDSLRHSVILAK